MAFIKKLFENLGRQMNVREVSTQEAFGLVKEGWRLVDVRTPKEFAELRAQGALNLPLDQLSAELVQEKCACQKLLLICHSGGRSKQACQKLCGAAGLEVASVHGGTSAWAAGGLPVERGVKG